MRRSDISVPSFASAEKRTEYLGDIFARRKPFPWMNGGMGIGFSDVELVTSVMEEGGIGTLAGSAVGYNAHREHILAAPNAAARAEYYRDANVQEITRQIAAVRSRVPKGCLGLNLMAALSDFRSMVDAAGSSGEVDFLFVGAGLPRELAKHMERYPHMRYVPIVSSARATEIMQKAAKGDAPPPAAFYVELPQFAGGHLGAKDAADALDAQKFDPQKLHDEIRPVAGDVPLILAGGIAYGSDITRAFAMGYDGVSMGTRLLLTRESGMPDDIITRYYLDARSKIVTGMTSPAGMPSRYLEVSATSEENPVEIRRRCVTCMARERCRYCKAGGEDESFCIIHRLAGTRRGEEGGTLFTGSHLAEMRNDDLYRRNDALYIPTVREALAFVFRGMDAT